MQQGQPHRERPTPTRPAAAGAAPPRREHACSAQSKYTSTSTLQSRRTTSYAHRRPRCARSSWTPWAWTTGCGGLKRHARPTDARPRRSVITASTSVSPTTSTWRPGVRERHPAGGGRLRGYEGPRSQPSCRWASRTGCPTAGSYVTLHSYRSSRSSGGWHGAQHPRNARPRPAAFPSRGKARPDLTLAARATPTELVTVWPCAGDPLSTQTGPLVSAPTPGTRSALRPWRVQRRCPYERMPDLVSRRRAANRASWRPRPSWQRRRLPASCAARRAGPGRRRQPGGSPPRRSCCPAGLPWASS